MKFENELRKSKNEWEFKVYQLIKRIPKGCVITYGGLAKWVNRNHRLKIIARNIGNLRNKLHDFLGHDSDLPLHRIAKKGDARSEYDSPKTRKYNQGLRTAEGSWPEPTWLYDKPGV